jgi:hypothetical protein
MRCGPRETGGLGTGPDWAGIEDNSDEKSVVVSM